MNDLALIRGLNELSEVIRKEVERVIIEQGHKLTGDIYTDVQNIVKAISNGYLLEGHYRDYSIYLHKGVRPERIPYQRGSGRKISKYIEALKQYARHRGMTDPDRAAFAIATVQKREGMPTRASRRFSQTGQRLKFLDSALDNQRVDEKANQVVFYALDLAINNILSNQQRLINSTR